MKVKVDVKKQHHMEDSYDTNLKMFINMFTIQKLVNMFATDTSMFKKKKASET